MIRDFQTPKNKQVISSINGSQIEDDSILFELCENGEDNSIDEYLIANDSDTLENSN